MTTHADFFLTGNAITMEPTAAETPGAYAFNVKDMLVTATWTVLASGDGLSGFSSTGDIIVTQTDMNQALAWVRVVSPDAKNEYIIQCVVVGLNNRHRVVWNGGNGATFTNGGSATQHPELVGGTEIVLVGVSGTAASPSVAGDAYWWGDTGATEPGMKSIGAAETVAPYRFWASANQPNSPFHKPGGILLDHVDAPFAGDNGYVGYCGYSSGGGWSIVVLESDIATQGAAWGLSGGTARRLIIVEQQIRNAEIPENPSGTSFMSPSYWAQNDSQANSIGLFGPSTMLNQMIDVASGNTSQNTQISTAYGALSHVRADDFALPWPSMTSFTHNINPWNVQNKALFDIVPAVDPNAGGGGTGPGTAETIAPVVQNLDPVDLSELTRDDYITFQAVDIDSEVNKVFIWVSFEGDSHTELVFDGDSFVGAFSSHSTVTESLSSHSFSVRPTGGWTQNISGFTVKIADIWGNFDEEDGGPGGGTGN